LKDYAEGEEEIPNSKSWNLEFACFWGTGDDQTMPRRLIIVGAGPAGLTAAIVAARAGAKVLVLEQLDRPGAKLSVCGGGRGNVTIRLAAKEMAAAYGRQGRFALAALEAMDAQGLCDFLSGLGVPTVCPDGLHVYPASQRAGDVTAALVRECRRLGVEIRCGVAVDELVLDVAQSPSAVHESDRPAAVRGIRANGQDWPADGIILAAGGCSYAALGGTGAGLKLARKAGHTIVEPVPALVPLVTQETWPAKLAGVSVAEATLRIDLPHERQAASRGDILFTHRGLSGPAVLNLSGRISRLLIKASPVPVLLSLPLASSGIAPGESAAAILERWRVSAGASQVRTLLARQLPRALVDALCEQAGVAADTPAARLPRPVQDDLAQRLAATRLTITRTEGFEHAMVTAGGVALKEVDPRTLASRLIGRLAFAGEILDLDGPTGGFNLHWAFASGALAGTAFSGE
jgi:hypothetical protein